MGQDKGGSPETTSNKAMENVRFEEAVGGGEFFSQNPVIRYSSGLMILVNSLKLTGPCFISTNAPFLS